MDMLQDGLSSSCEEDQRHYVVDEARHVHFHCQGTSGVAAPLRPIADLACIQFISCSSVLFKGF